MKEPIFGEVKSLREKKYTHTQTTTGLSYSRRGTNTTIGNYPEGENTSTRRYHLVILKGKTSEGDPPSERASGYGRTTFLKEPIFGEVKSLRKKKYTHNNNGHDVKVAGAPGSAAWKGSHVPVQSRAYITPAHRQSRDGL